MDLSFLYHQLVTRLPYPTADHSGQCIIVTGSNVGLGLEAARHFVRLKAEKVILAVRNLKKGEDAKKSIEETTQRKGVVEVWQLDLSSYESTKQFAHRAQGLKRLDAVVENAGIAVTEYSVAEDNEATITVNVVSTFLLALMLLPKLRESGSRFNFVPHLSIVSSEVHGWVKFSERNNPAILKTLNDEKTANMAERQAASTPERSATAADSHRYPMSKLLEIFYGRELAARTKDNGKSPVTINFLNPGLCHSELTRNAPFFLTILKFFLARSTEHGSRSLVNAAEGGPETHGQYLSNCHVIE